uniref:Uncharacterized protein n=1 Tax=Anguilla anguilla TaxID=7936 RepID=A0A0E9WQE2_ANGAN
MEQSKVLKCGLLYKYGLASFPLTYSAASY